MGPQTCAETASHVDHEIIVSTLCIVLICAAVAEESSDDGYSTEFVVPETSLSDKSPFMPKSWVQQQLHKQTNQLLAASTTTTKGAKKRKEKGGTRPKGIQEGKEESHK